MYLIEEIIGGHPYAQYPPAQTRFAAWQNCILSLLSQNLPEQANSICLNTTPEWDLQHIPSVRINKNQTFVLRLAPKETS